MRRRATFLFQGRLDEFGATPPQNDLGYTQVAISPIHQQQNAGASDHALDEGTDPA